METIKTVNGIEVLEIPQPTPPTPPPIVLSRKDVKAQLDDLNNQENNLKTDLDLRKAEVTRLQDSLISIHTQQDLIKTRLAKFKVE